MNPNIHHHQLHPTNTSQVDQSTKPPATDKALTTPSILELQEAELDKSHQPPMESLELPHTELETTLLLTELLDLHHMEL